MLAVVSPLENNTGRDGGDQMVGFSIADDFPDFSDDNLLESIDFDDLFVGMEDRDMLPDLEMDPELLNGEFSLSGGEDSSDQFNTSVNSFSSGDLKAEDLASRKEEVVSKRDRRNEGVATNPGHKEKESDRGRKSSDKSKNSCQGKRKVKVNKNILLAYIYLWTFYILELSRLGLGYNRNILEFMNYNPGFFLYLNNHKTDILYNR